MPDGTKLTDVKMYWTTKAEVEPNWKMKLKDALETISTQSTRLTHQELRNGFMRKGTKMNFESEKAIEKRRPRFT